MDEELAQVLQALRGGTAAKAMLPGLQQQQQRAMALRDQPLADIDEKTGYMSPFQAAANMIKKSRAEKEVQRLDPMIAQTMMAGIEGDRGLQEYKLKQALAKQQEDKRQWQADFDEKVAGREQAMDIAKMQTAHLGGGTPQTYVDPDTGEAVTFYKRAGSDMMFDEAGNEAVVGNRIPIDQYNKIIKSQSDKDKEDKLTPNQLRAELKDYRKDVNNYMPIIQSINALNETLMQQDDLESDIPGIGYLEGGSGTLSSVVRGVKDLFDSEDGASKVYAQWTGVIAPLIREQAGLAQTQTELQRVEKTFGSDWLTDEDVFREQYPKVMQALSDDLDTMDRTYSKQTKDFYSKEDGKTIQDYANQMFNPFERQKKIKRLQDIDLSKPPKGVDAEEWNSLSDQDKQDYYVYGVE